MSDPDTLAWLRPSKPCVSGRYALDRHGRLHPARYARIVRAVAFVIVRVKEPLAKPSPARRARSPQHAGPPIEKSVRSDPGGSVTVIEKKAPVDYLRAVKAHLNRPILKSTPPPRRAVTVCRYCEEPGPVICEYCKAVEDAA